MPLALEASGFSSPHPLPLPLVKLQSHVLSRDPPTMLCHEFSAFSAALSFLSLRHLAFPRVHETNCGFFSFLSVILKVFLSPFCFFHFGVFISFFLFVLLPLSFLLIFLSSLSFFLSSLSFILPFSLHIFLYLFFFLPLYFPPPLLPPPSSPSPSFLLSINPRLSNKVGSQQGSVWNPRQPAPMSLPKSLERPPCICTPPKMSLLTEP